MELAQARCQPRTRREEDDMSDETTLRSALDQLAHAATDAPGTCWTTTVLATAVVDLERAANASLGQRTPTRSWCCTAAWAGRTACSPPSPAR